MPLNPPHPCDNCGTATYRWSCCSRECAEALRRKEAGEVDEEGDVSRGD